MPELRHFSFIPLLHAFCVGGTTYVTFAQLAEHALYLGMAFRQQNFSGHQAPGKQESEQGADKHDFFRGPSGIPTPTSNFPAFHQVSKAAKCLSLTFLHVYVIASTLPQPSANLPQHFVGVSLSPMPARHSVCATLVRPTGFPEPLPSVLVS